MDFKYYNIDKKTVTSDINDIFPGFGKNEVLAVMSPHDDDAIIGAGYAMLAAESLGAEVYVSARRYDDIAYITVEGNKAVRYGSKAFFDALKNAEKTRF